MIANEVEESFLTTCEVEQSTLLPRVKETLLKMQTDKTKGDNDPSCNTDQGVLELCECYGNVKQKTRSESKSLCFI